MASITGSSTSLYTCIQCWRRKSPGPSISNPNLKASPKTWPRVGKSMRWTPLSLGFRVRMAWRGGRNLSNCCLASLIVWITSLGSLPKYSKILGGSARVEKNREAEKYAHSEERASARPHTHRICTYSHTSPPPLLFPGSPAPTVNYSNSYWKESKACKTEQDIFLFFRTILLFKTQPKIQVDFKNISFRFQHQRNKKILYAHKRNKKYTMRCQNGPGIIYKAESLSHC